jgi:hypothetical protein
VTERELLDQAEAAIAKALREDQAARRATWAAASKRRRERLRKHGLCASGCGTRSASYRCADCQRDEQNRARERRHAS